MSKWRPSSQCNYVIGDIHGAYDLLECCLKRILPLRKDDNLIFLGDFIDRHEDSHLVLDTLIKLKNDYPDQVHCIMGNHEELLLTGLNLMFNPLPHERSASWKCWLANGGINTLNGYWKSVNVDPVPLQWNNEKIIDEVIPRYHLDFLMTLPSFVKIDNYIFLHAGLNPTVPIEQHPRSILHWDRKLFDTAKLFIAYEEEMPWNMIIVTGHNGPNPIFSDKYYMLDAGSPFQLLIFETNSKEGYLAKQNQNRLVKYDTSPTVFKKSPFRRQS